MTKLLWIAPSLNFYKARFLNLLSKELDLFVVAGKLHTKDGHAPLDEQLQFKVINVNAVERQFSWSPRVIFKTVKAIRKERPDKVLMPAEKKHLPLIMVLALLKPWLGIELISYNHSHLRSNKSLKLDFFLSRWVFSWYDTLVFYTQHCYDFAIKHHLVNKNKAHWVSNTLDDTEIKSLYTFNYPPAKNMGLLFIGRLVEKKRLDILLNYYKTLSQHLPDLMLHIIGDGPMASMVQEESKANPRIICYGSLTNEKELSEIFAQSALVFVPGHSGLSINHAFFYGRPYVTFKSATQPPEFNYIEDDVNGLVLQYGQDTQNLERLKELLGQPKKLQNFCEEAYAKGKQLSIENWVKKMATLLTTSKS
ncbi:glycosyltransferase family 4 protein [Psychroserpens mesophilus]|uniref:glycosyltransferase family 4 protein n=1 Tax=Psychroserpens mesophilus TaxID=325473 RepID=UPI003F495E8F